MVKVFDFKDPSDFKEEYFAEFVIKLDYVPYDQRKTGIPIGRGLKGSSSSTSMSSSLSPIKSMISPYPSSMRSSGSSPSPSPRPEIIDRHYYFMNNGWIYCKDGYLYQPATTRFPPQYHFVVVTESEAACEYWLAKQNKIDGAWKYRMTMDGVSQKLQEY